MICSEIHETCGLPMPKPIDVLPQQSSEALAMRVATAMYQFELRTLIHHFRLPKVPFW